MVHLQQHAHRVTTEVLTDEQRGVERLDVVDHVETPVKALTENGGAAGVGRVDGVDVAVDPVLVLRAGEPGVVEPSLGNPLWMVEWKL